MIALLAVFILATLASRGPGEVLYAWVGNPSGDYLATIDNDKWSSTFGSVIHQAFLPTNNPNVNPTGNQAHHIAVSRGGNFIIVGGLLSFLNAKDEVFVFNRDTGIDVSFYSSTNLPGGCTDEFHPTNFWKTEFIVSQMCADNGDSPGYLIKWNVITNENSVWSPSGLTNFNPHGGDWNPSGGGLLIADFVKPISLFGPPTGFVFRDTVRYFNNDGSQRAVYTMPGPSNAGYIATRWVSSTKAIAIGSASQNKMYLINTANSAITSVLDFGATIGAGFNAGLPLVNIDFRKGFVAYGLRYLVLFSWTSSFSFSTVQVFDFCTASAGYTPVPCSTLVNNLPGSHYLALSQNEKRILVSNSFVTVGNAQFPGSGTIYSFKINGNWASFTIETAFHPNLNGGLPHGIASAAGDCDSD